MRRIGPALLLHFPRYRYSPERYALIVRGRWIEWSAPAEIIRTAARTARRLSWPLVRVYRNWRADRAWRELRRLDCHGRHSVSVTRDGACDQCRPYLLRVYPQGWQYYPGDCCPHGTYVGGCGPDIMCAACEAGH